MNAKQVIAVSALALLGANTAFAQEASSDAWMKVASTKSRAEVQAEVAATDRAVLRAGEATVFAATPAHASKSRDEVRAEARANGARFTQDVSNVGA
jgi:lipopolysaccharide export system protein LptA